MVVKHCQAFQISVAHQKDLEKKAHRPPTHAIQNQTDQKVKTRDTSTGIKKKRKKLPSLRLFHDSFVLFLVSYEFFWGGGWRGTLLFIHI